MNEPPQTPHLSPQAQADRDARRAREAAALRANLARRKQQQRARDLQPPAPSQDPTQWA